MHCEDEVWAAKHGDFSRECGDRVCNNVIITHDPTWVFGGTGTGQRYGGHPISALAAFAVSRAWVNPL